MPSLRQLSHLTQIAVLLAFVGLLVLLHFRNREDQQHAFKMRSLDELHRDSLEQQHQADDLLERAQKKLAAAEAWKPEWITEPDSGEPRKANP